MTGVQVHFLSIIDLDLAIIYTIQYLLTIGFSLKRIEMARLKRKENEKTSRRRRRRLNFENEKAHYGEECQRPDMSAEDYETAKNHFLQHLQEQVNPLVWGTPSTHLN